MKKLVWASVVIFAIILMAWSGCAFLHSTAIVTTSAAANRWAKAVDVPGAPNLHQVSPTLYRSAALEPAGFAAIKNLGVKTVVNLRAFHSDRKETAAAGLQYEHIYFKTWHAEDEDVVRFLKIVTDPARQPALVHCQHGADRTGTLCAIYRIAVEGWSKEEAIDEMMRGDYGYHEVWVNLPPYIRGLDIDKIRAAAGLPSAKDK